ncbi:MAG: MFS transporter [Buchnera aphidicola (Pentalonia nigronervosa)]|uniref:MFS transporter n=1 Tax=Buchnera aphidicola (Pentalonia nigronervosa) TaxID=1309793 RepID=A0A7H1B046_9GAMM|nr:MAG: MFS transporter [Buchnera aphidicola (Pentalonia nigronervosa)]
MNFLELQVTLSLCTVFLLRMFSVFSVFPILSKYGICLNGSNTFLIGIAIGIYGLSQVIFQIPFGLLSDYFDRKKVIIFGLFLVFLGNIMSASTNSIWGLICGRFIQGSGAISGVSMAFLSDVIREEHRVKSISAIGISFSVSFLLSVVTSPLIVQYSNFFVLFWLCAILSLICIIVVYYFFPTVNNNLKNDNINFLCKKNIKLFMQKQFFIYYLSIFCLHFLLMMNFSIVPHQLELSGLLFFQHWKMYLNMILISFLVLFCFIFYCKNQSILNNIVEICIFFLFVSSLLFFKSNSNLVILILSLQIFFIFFNLLEVFLPSNLSKNISKNSYKGSIMSIYSTSQFLGIFFGGLCSGWLYSFLSISNMFAFEAFFISIWFLLIIYYRKYYHKK